MNQSPGLHKKTRVCDFLSLVSGAYLCSSTSQKRKHLKDLEQRHLNKREKIDSDGACASVYWCFYSYSRI